jgi:hypothetical protein
MELMQVNQQWSSRPDDERHVSLLDFQAKTRFDREMSRQAVVSSRDITATADGDKGLLITGPKGNAIVPTHWAFGQLATLGDAPAAYLRKLHPALAADNLNYGLKVMREIEDVGVYIQLPDGDGLPTLKAATGPNYGRVFNSQIADILVNRFGDGLTGQWKVPGEFGKPVPITKANTTIYGSDRDCFVFLCDEHNRIEMSDRRDGKAGSLARGFFVWNSEVGGQSFGFAMFLFDYACSNRIVWGAQQFKQLRFRHTKSAPDKLMEDIQPVLIEYAESAAGPIEAAIAGAQRAKVEAVSEFLASRNFSKSLANSIQRVHMEEEGKPIESMWDVATGITAYAKTVTYQDERVRLEREAGKVLDLVAA